MTKAQAHFRLDTELLEAIKVRAEKESITITDLVTRFLKQGLGMETDNIIPAINQQEIEEVVYQRISESVSSRFNDLEDCISNSVSNKIYALETDVFNRISERVSLMIDEIEKRVSQRVSSQQYEEDTMADIKSIERISEEPKHLETIESTESVSNDVSQRYTQNQQQELIEITNASLFETNLESGEVMKPSKLVSFLNTQTKSEDWNIDKVKNIRRKHLTWLKNSKNPDKKVIKEPPLPMMIEEYLIDWIFSEEESPTSTGKEWWIQKLPETEVQKNELIKTRQDNWIKIND